MNKHKNKNKKNQNKRTLKLNKQHIKIIIKKNIKLNKI